MIRALLALARPRAALLIASLPLVGFGYALWERGSTIHIRYVLGRMSLLFASWLCCHAGSLWLNAELDRDQGEVLLGEPVEVPPGAGLAGYAALCLAVAIASRVGLPTMACAGLCAGLAVLYSHPRVALKATPVGGPLVNGLGYGALSPIAGWAAAAPVLTWRALTLLGLTVTFLLGVYFSAQAFQEREDRARGDRTLVATHGPRATLLVARGCLLTASVGAMALSGIGVLPRALLISAPAWVWVDRHLATWSTKAHGGTAADATRLVSMLAVAIGVMLVAVYADHAVALFRRLPPGGCGTAIVPRTLAEACL